MPKVSNFSILQCSPFKYKATSHGTFWWVHHEILQNFSFIFHCVNTTNKLLIRYTRITARQNAPIQTRSSGLYTMFCSNAPTVLDRCLCKCILLGSLGFAYFQHFSLFHGTLFIVCCYLNLCVYSILQNTLFPFNSKYSRWLHYVCVFVSWTYDFDYIYLVNIIYIDVQWP